MSGSEDRPVGGGSARARRERQALEAGPGWSGSKRLASFEPLALPPLLGEAFERMERAGAVACALFGGAARDADLGALWGRAIPIKDYDMRAWLDPSEMARAGWEERFAHGLESAFEGSRVELVPSAGAGRARHVLLWRGIEIDASARALPWAGASSADCAAERALDSDASLCSVAIAPGSGAVCEALYLADGLSGAISFYPGTEPGRLRAYRARMLAKFPQALPADLEPARAAGARP